MRASGFPTAVALLLAAAVGFGCSAWYTADLLVGRDPRVLYSVDTPEPVLALTLDDGPDPEATPAILEVLARHGVRATFFLIADRVEGNEALVQALIDAGHEIANHGVRDRPQIDLDAEDFESALVEAHGVLAPFGSIPWFRPGSGWYDDEMLEVLERHGYRAALGSIYPLDAQQTSVGLTRRFILWRAKPGGVIILHDGGARGRRTAKALDELLPELDRRGYRVVPLTELVALGAPEEEAP